MKQEISEDDPFQGLDIKAAMEVLHSTMFDRIYNLHSTLLQVEEEPDPLENNLGGQFASVKTLGVCCTNIRMDC